MLLNKLFDLTSCVFSEFSFLIQYSYLFFSLQAINNVQTVRDEYTGHDEHAAVNNKYHVTSWFSTNCKLSYLKNLS